MRCPPWFGVSVAVNGESPTYRIRVPGLVNLELPHTTVSVIRAIQVEAEPASSLSLVGCFPARPADAEREGLIMSYAT
jgi:hypothetical protein